MALSHLRRAWLATSRLRPSPGPDAILLSVCHDAPVGNPWAKYHTTTLISLLSGLSAAGDFVYVSTGRVNYPYLFRVLGWYPTVRWLTTPPDWHRWEIAVCDESARFPDRARRRWHVRYDFRPGVLVGPEHQAIPYPVHPGLLHSDRRGSLERRFAALRPAPRRCRMLFAASLGERYSKPESDSVLGRMPNRLAVADAVSVHPACDHWTDGEMPSAAGLVYRNCSRHPIPSADWLATIGSADVYVCAPGCIVPMCYSAAEAMAVGTIPLISYPDWFPVPLEDGVNCFAYGSIDELPGIIDRVLAMPSERVLEMRRACVDYYITRLAPRTVMPGLRSIDATELTIHLLDETYHHLGIEPVNP